MTDKPYRHTLEDSDADTARIDAMNQAWAEGRKAGLEEAAKIVERGMIYGNRESPQWAQRIIASEIRRVALQ